MFPIGKPSNYGANEQGNFTPEGLQEVQDVFDALLEECGLPPGSEEATRMAKAVFHFYQSGQSNPTVIREMLAPAFRRPGRVRGKYGRKSKARRGLSGRF
ncbi:hypothetical protein GGQ64_002416 [Rhizobium azooxidifex]|uniref:Uncharacterized protein n=1 Tax=Mycoplana azooxidifex TaxID=1636188 RepID=A0A7W6GJ56_9HYPH|nr:hypothetical protein [Mycoplana azooxidifex]